MEATAIGKYSALTFELVLLLILVVWPRGLGISVATGVEDVIERFVKSLGQPRAAAPSGDPDVSGQSRVSEQTRVSGGRDHG